jgi:mannose-6-phosphate isomerase-like protein (cupin superfamily)
MFTENRLPDMTSNGMKLTMLKAGPDTNGRSLDMEWEVLPGCNMKDPLMQTHYHQISTYEVLEGELEFFVIDRWIKAKKGESIFVEKGTTHTFRNTANNIARLYNTYQPAMEIEDYLKGLSQSAGKLISNRRERE